MGVITLFSSGSDPQPGNPDPRRFTVKRAVGYGDYWVEKGNAKRDWLTSMEGL